MLTNQLDEHDLVAVHGDDESDCVIFPAVHNLARLWQIPRQLVHLCNLFRCQLLRRSPLKIQVPEARIIRPTFPWLALQPSGKLLKGCRGSTSTAWLIVDSSSLQGRPSRRMDMIHAIADICSALPGNSGPGSSVVHLVGPKIYGFRQSWVPSSMQESQLFRCCRISRRTLVNASRFRYLSE
jgi:hypothetical protein